MDLQQLRLIRTSAFKLTTTAANASLKLFRIQHSVLQTFPMIVESSPLVYNKRVRSAYHRRTAARSSSNRVEKIHRSCVEAQELHYYSGHLLLLVEKIKGLRGRSLADSHNTADEVQQQGSQDEALFKGLPSQRVAMRFTCGLHTPEEAFV